MTDEKTTEPMSPFGRTSQQALRIFAWLLALASIWGLVDLVQMWNEPVKLASGTPGRVIEETEAGRYRYSLPFEVGDTGEMLTLSLPNHGPVTDYFMAYPERSVAVLYWPSKRSILSVYPLVAGEERIRGQYPPYNALLGTSLLGIVLAATLLLGGPLDRLLYRIGRG